MIEPEDDLVILDEIRALKNVLAAEKPSEPSDVPKDSPKLHNLTNANRRVNFGSRGFGEVSPCYDNQDDVNSCGKGEETQSGSCQSALEANEKLLALLRETKRDLAAMLEKCRENKAIVEERIKERAQSAFKQKIRIGMAGMPYFKDAKQFSQPRNEDALRKIENSELQIVHLRSPVQWTLGDRNILWRAIRQEAAGAILRNESTTSTAAGDKDIQSKLVLKGFNLPKNFKAMVGPIGTREFDWMKIAAMNLDNKHTPEECKVMWQVFLHPDINRYRWTKEEDDNIVELSKKYNYQDWDTLAKELGTNRTGYQCFIRNNTITQLVCMTESSWSPEEDQHLKLCIDTLKIGNYIPWGVVSRYMEGRTKMQVYFHWQYHASPHLKKGRFTAEEDETLVKAVKEHGENFGKISRFEMPHRSSVQLSEHYFLLRQRERGLPSNVWTVNDDARVIKLYKKYGADWSKIAVKFPDKTRTQVRHRHRSILKYWSKGISIYEIPRIAGITEGPAKAETDSDADENIASIERERVEKMQSKYCNDVLQVDFELMKHFSSVQPTSARPGRKQKYYKPEELEDVTRKLYVLLQAMNAELEIPRELDDRNLSEKDRQLLVSLQSYREAQIECAKRQNEAVKYLRVFDDDDAIREVHFAPLCPGDCNRNEKVRFNDTIDCEMPDVLDCQVTQELTMQTPAIVMEYVDQDTSEEFDRLAKFLITPKNEACAVRKIYVLKPEICSKALTTTGAGKSVTNPAGSCPTQDEERMAIKQRRVNRNKVWDSSISEGIIYNPDRTIVCVEPNYHTLLGLKHIMAEDSGKKKSTVDRASMSEEAKKSMQTLKKRLIQLFRFPIGLSHILRPEVYMKSVQVPGIADVAEDSPEDPPKEPTEPPPPPAKRKRVARTQRKKGGNM